MPRSATKRKPETLQAELPETLIAPSAAADKDREAYWINLLANVDELKAATETTDFFVLCQEFPPAAWDRLTIYLYRLTDDAGMLIKNSDDKPHYIKVLRQPLTEEFVAKNWGGGKYQALLKIDNKEVLRKHTFRIDGDPKVLPGQRVEVEGKIVPLNGAAPAPVAADAHSDVAAVIQASSDANKQNMEILAAGSKAAIELVREQSSAALKPDPQNGMVEKLLTVLLERVMQPPAPAADPIDTFVKLQGLIQKNNPEPADPKDPPLEEAMTLVEKFTGKTFSELMKGNKAAAAVESGPNWGAIALGVAEKFFAVAPTLFQQAIYSRQQEFQRAVWLRSAKPGEAPPPNLLTVNVPQITQAPANGNGQPAQQAQPQPQPQPDSAAAPDPMALAGHLVQMICHGFDQDPYSGGETAAAICFNFGKHIEAAGFEAMISDPAEVDKLVAGHPLLQQRSTHAKWPQFQAEFLEYMGDRFGLPEPEKPGPQPVA